MACNVNHTDFQPKVKEFVCPKCESNGDFFRVDDEPVDAEDGCVLLHEEDWCSCRFCAWEGTGKDWVRETELNRKQKELKNAIPF